MNVDIRQFWDIRGNIYIVIWRHLSYFSLGHKNNFDNKPSRPLLVFKGETKIIAFTIHHRGTNKEVKFKIFEKVDYEHKF